MTTTQHQRHSTPEPFNHSAAHAALARYRNRLMALDGIPSTAHVTFSMPALLHAPNTSTMIHDGLDAFRRLNPHWTVREWDDAAIETYLQQRLRPHEYRMLAHLHAVEKSDLWRLLVMCREGGLYMDIDRLVNMPMSRLLGKHTKMLLPLFRGFGSANAAGRVVSRWTTSSPFGLTQDLMVSAAGNPLHCEAAALNVAEHAACRDPLRQLWGDCTIIKLGPELFMHSALLSLFGGEGEAIWRAVRASNGHATRRFVIHALQTLQPYAFARDEILPVDTLLFDAQRASDRSWTRERLEREKQLLYARTGMTHWTRQPWWQLRVGRWLGLLAG